ncbi:MAG TPA: hypothetical protein DCR10_09530 [Acidimicrobiaceae bacterium]|nr:hypothetical protein [Acidimicrobiaceae bacterium]
MRRIIVNADDFGLCNDVTQGILDAHLNEQVSSTTLMVNMQATEQAVEIAHSHPRLGVGLHFNLTEGRPLTSVPSLVDESGQFLLRGELLRRCLRRAIDPGDIRREFEAQLTRIHEHGIVPTHIDSHQHVHMAPWVFRAMAPVLDSQVSRMRLVRPPRRPKGSLSSPISSVRNTSMSMAARRIQHRFAGATNDRLVSLHLLPANRGWTSTDYEAVVSQTEPSDLVEVMVHPFSPGSDLEEMYQNDPIREIRLEFARQCWEEHRLLTSVDDPPFGRDRYHLVSWSEA